MTESILNFNVYEFNFKSRFLIFEFTSFKSIAKRYNIRE